jgi:hypothetical protein
MAIVRQEMNLLGEVRARRAAHAAGAGPGLPACRAAACRPCSLARRTAAKPRPPRVLASSALHGRRCRTACLRAVGSPDQACREPRAARPPARRNRAPCHRRVGGRGRRDPRASSRAAPEPARAAQVDQPGSAIDVYVDRLGAILARKAAGIAELQRRLDGFAEQLRAEEALSRSVGARRT